MKTYKPKPLDTSNIEVPKNLLDLADILACNMHENRALERTRHRNEKSDEEADIILDRAMHQYTESEHAISEAAYNREAAREPNEEPIIQIHQQPDIAGLQLFSMKGRSVQRVLDYSNEYLRQVSLP